MSDHLFSEAILGRLDAFLQRIEPLLPEPCPQVDWALTLGCRWRQFGQRGMLEPVPQIAGLRLTDLHCIDDQKAILLRNTRQFLKGLPANNALLWGPRGTGKSSLIKAMLTEFASDGLRFVEVDKHLLHDLPDVVAKVRGRSERFVIYCDDLSFERDDAGYKALKVSLDGTISGAPTNTLIYATSNRRHLMPEFMSDNQNSHLINGELHHGETVEEQLSLSERFGIWMAFHPFTQDQYLYIVDYWLRSFGDRDGVGNESARAAALQWALLRGSRSGRSAGQFARDWTGQKQLRDAENNA